MWSKFKNSGGVALLLVLTTLALISAIVVEFAYNEDVNYNVALNESDQLKAHYLALSGLNFAKLIIKYDKEVKGLAKSYGKKLGQNVQIPPLYEMVPINTSLFRTALSSGGSVPEEGGGEAPTEENTEAPEGEENPISDNEIDKKSVSLLDQKAFEEFLNFDGDFEAIVEEESTKINLNAFYDLRPNQSEYLILRGTLAHLLASEDFKNFFENPVKDAPVLAAQIADFIDKDEEINGDQGQNAGSEKSVYTGESTGPKNAKLISLEEILLVPGMNDDIFQKLKDKVTIYGSDHKIFICRAQPELVNAMLLSYAEFDSSIDVKTLENKEVLDKASEAVLGECPETKNMDNNLKSILGVGSNSALNNESNLNNEPNLSSNGAKSSSATGGFAKMLTDESNYFFIKVSGFIEESTVKIYTVYDTSNQSPQRWQLLYWRVE